MDHFYKIKTHNFDAIVIDLPDPINVEFAQYYSELFYSLCYDALTDEGYIVSQSGSLYGKNNVKSEIWLNARTAGFQITPYHAQIPTIGHWSWFIGNKKKSNIKDSLSSITLKNKNKMVESGSHGYDAEFW